MRNATSSKPKRVSSKVVKELSRLKKWSRKLFDSEIVVKSEVFDLVFVGLQFAESQAFDLLQLIRNERDLNVLPVIMYSGRKSRVTDFLIATAGRCAKLLGAYDFLDFMQYRNDEHGQTEIRLFVDKCLNERFIGQATLAESKYERGQVNARQRDPR